MAFGGDLRSLLPQLTIQPTLSWLFGCDQSTAPGPAGSRRARHPAHYDSWRHFRACARHRHRVSQRHCSGHHRISYCKIRSEGQGEAPAARGAIMQLYFYRTGTRAGARTCCTVCCACCLSGVQVAWGVLYLILCLKQGATGHLTCIPASPSHQPGSIHNP